MAHLPCPVSICHPSYHHGIAEPLIHHLGLGGSSFTGPGGIVTAMSCSVSVLGDVQGSDAWQIVAGTCANLWESVSSMGLLWRCYWMPAENLHVPQVALSFVHVL